VKLSTRGRYGLRAVLDIAINQGDGPITLHSISERQGISVGYLEQLMVPLKKEGLIRSVRGAQGGYLLAREPEKITVGDIIRASKDRLRLLPVSVRISQRNVTGQRGVLRVWFGRKSEILSLKSWIH